MTGNGLTRHEAASRVASRAPGKIILGGEHAVVYGRPALVLAVDRYAHVVAERLADGRICLEMPDHSFSATWRWDALRRTAGGVALRFEAYCRGEADIGEVIRDPGDAACQALYLALKEAPDAARRGMRVCLTADLATGCGMGSSAAAAVALLAAVARVGDVQADVACLSAWAHAVESLHHGRPSGADAHASLHGGLFRFATQAARKLDLPLPSLHLVDTGRPVSSTGECVAAVARRCGQAGPWPAFEEVERAMEAALSAHDTPSLAAAVRANHRLLCDIGVVPSRVARFIDRIEQSGGAAKICGAGAVRGDRAGMVWLACGGCAADLCRAYGYESCLVKGVPHGVHFL